MPDQPDIIDLLLRDHDVIRELAEELDDTDDLDAIRGLFLRIVKVLSAHEAAEHQVLFPAFRATLTASDDTTVHHRMGEHEELNELLADMRSLAPDSPAFIKRGSALLLDLQGHFQIEEESVFARLRASLTPEELADLAIRAEVVKQHAPAFPDDPASTPA